MDTTIAVYLSEEEATRFVAFQKRYSFIKLLDDIGAFDIKSGSVTIHFDNIGQIGSIDKYYHLKL